MFTRHILTACRQSCLHLAAISCFLSLAVVLTYFSIEVQAKERQISREIAQIFRSPNRGVPPNAAGAASRSSGSQCRKDANTKLSLISLMPDNNFGLTLSNNPTLLFYIPPTSARTAEFIIKDDEDRDIYRKTLALTGMPGIISVPAMEESNIPVLQIDRNYQWYFVIICNPNNRFDDISVQGWLQRMEASPVLTEEIKQAQGIDRVAVYAKNGIWYDAIATIAQLRYQYPNNTELAKSWQELLKSVGLEQVVNEPLINCCRAIGNSN